MKDLILKLLDEYIKANNLVPKIEYVMTPDVYFLFLLTAENKYIYRDKFIVEEYKNSTVLYFKDKRYDFLNDKFEEEFKKIIHNLK